jgi:hypothetical protein
VKKSVVIFISFFAATNALSQTTKSNINETLNSILSICSAEMGSIQGLDQLDKEKAPGIKLGDKKWFQRDLTKLIDQDIKPSKGEKDAIFLARTIAKDCNQKIISEIKSVFPLQFGAMNDAIFYYVETYWMALLNDQLTYGELTKIRLDVANDLQERTKEMQRLWKLGTKDSQAEMNQHVELAEKRFMAALEKHQQMIAARKGMGFTNCKKLGAFEYCSANP